MVMFAPLSKSAVCAFQISCTLLPFTLKVSWRNSQMMCSSLTKGSIYHINVHTTFYHSSWLTRNLTCNGSTYSMCYICRYCGFTCYSSNGTQCGLYLKKDLFAIQNGHQIFTIGISTFVRPTLWHNSTVNRT